VRVWSFIFPDPSSPVVSARVAAPTKGAALDTLGDKLGLGLGAARCIGQFLGHDALDRGVISLVRRA
jgi:hypothetical protein